MKPDKPLKSDLKRSKEKNFKNDKTSLKTDSLQHKIRSNSPLERKPYHSNMYPNDLSKMKKSL